MSRQIRDEKPNLLQAPSLRREAKACAYPSHQLTETHGCIDRDDRQAQSGRLPDNLLGEEPVASEQVCERLPWLARLLWNPPGRSALREGGAPELRSWDKPDGLVWMTQERRHESRQQSEPLDEYRWILW